MLLIHHIRSFKTETGFSTDLEVTYQLFGEKLGTAPVVLVNHALTGNSSVTGENGWWNSLIGKSKLIDTDCFTVLAIDIPGNGFDGKSENLITNYKEFHNRDIAQVQWEVIRHLGISQLFAVIGGSLGGQIAWELAALQPDLIEHLIPIATDWKATDWVIAQCLIQEQFLLNSSKPLHDARMHAMTFYRTAASFTQKFDRSINDDLGIYNVESWLLHHGQRLEERFHLSTYKLMNHLLGTADVLSGRGVFQEVLKTLKCSVHLIGINTDGLFYPEPIRETHALLEKIGVKSTYQELQSIHGHDAFLIEYDQLSQMLAPIFNEVCITN